MKVLDKKAHIFPNKSKKLKNLMQQVQHQDATKGKDSDTLSHISSLLHGQNILQLGDIDKITN